MNKAQQTLEGIAMSGTAAIGVLNELVETKQLKPSAVVKAAKVVTRRANQEIEQVQRRLDYLRSIQQPDGNGNGKVHVTGAPDVVISKTGPRAAKAAAPKMALKRSAAKRGITPEQEESRRIQGKYMSMSGRFNEKKRAEFSKLAKERGREAALKEMQAAYKRGDGVKRGMKRPQARA